MGTGAFGEVYLAEHLNLKVLRAIKCIKKSQDIYGLAIREADILKNLRHPSIPIIYDIEENNECVCIIEEYMSGLSLYSYLSNKPIKSIKEIISICVKICEVTMYLHSKKIYHHDIKPQNIICSEGNIKLLDYGSAVYENETQIKNIGTHGYAAPEMYYNKPVGEQGDVYSIGVVLLMLATSGQGIEALRNVHPPALRMLINQCLAHSKKERIRSVKELKRKLNKILENKIITNVPLNISMVGIHPHAGTTHCAMMAALAFKQDKRETVIFEKNETGDYFKMIHTAAKVIFQKGCYYMDGLCIVPNYKGHGELPILKGEEIEIYDYGILTQQNYSEILSKDVICLVCGSASYELEPFINNLGDTLVERLIQEALDQKKEIRVLINYASIQLYKKVVRRYGILNPVRVPFSPELMIKETGKSWLRIE